VCFFPRSRPRCNCTTRRPGLCLLGVIFPSGHDATPSSSRTPAIYDTSNRVCAGPFGRSAPIGHVETDRSTARWRRPTYQGPEGFRGRSAESTAQRTSTHPVRSSPDRKVVPYLRQDVSRCHSSLLSLRVDPTHWPNIGSIIRAAISSRSSASHHKLRRSDPARLVSRANYLPLSLLRLAVYVSRPFVCAVSARRLAPNSVDCCRPFVLQCFEAVEFLGAKLAEAYR
jgi:hypothetical protein